jgi:flagellar hook-associated protein 2
MAYASIGGLASGLDTATMISQLMKLEALPQTGLKSRVTTQERQVTALQALNTKLATVATKAAALTQVSGWAPAKAASTSEHVTVTAGASAQPTSLTFTVDRLAGNHQVSYAQAVRLTDRVATAATVTVDLLDGNGPRSIAVGDGTLASVAKAVSSAGLGVQASAVKADPVDVDGDGVPDEVYRLRVVSTSTGTASDFTLGGLDSTVVGAAATTAGQDARITIGSGDAALQTSSATNAFAQVAPGVDLALGAATPLATAVTLTVERDAPSMTASVKALVDAANAALDELKSLTSYDPATKKTGILAGDSTLRSIRDQLVGSVTSGGSMATVGIQVDRSGRVVFDQTKFTAAYAADPTGTAAKFAGNLTFTDDGTSTGTASLSKASWRTLPGTYAVSATSAGGTIAGRPATGSGGLLFGAADTPVEGLAISYTGDISGTVTYSHGLAARIEALAQRASDATEGSISLAVKSRNSSIGRLRDDIDNWDTRLDVRRAALERQFSALEVSLGTLQNQGNWLAGQLSGLPKWS